MTLVLRLRHAPAGIPLDLREVGGSSFRIGRGSESDWVLADPERVLSKCHCRLVENDVGWLVHDTSSNGTTLNGRTLDPAVPAPLNDGDRLALGSYEIEARMVDEAAPRDPARTRDSTEDPFPFPGSDEFGFRLPEGDPRSPFEPVTIDGAFPGRSELGNDRASDLQEHIRLPRTVAELLPEDWDAAPVPEASSPRPAPPEPAPEPVPPPPAFPPPPAVGHPGPVQAAAALGAMPGSGDDASGHGFAAFVEGAGMPGEAVADPAAALRALGEAFRALVHELRKTMMARAAIKSEFRIEQTMIRPAGNNPLKFAVDDADALSALLGVGRRSGMTPRRAVTDALRDMRLHELAVAAAMQQAVRDLLGELAPSRIEDGLPRTMRDRVPGRRDMRLWRAFRARHEQLSRALQDDFDSAFGKSFVRAYEAALHQAEDGDPADGEDGRT